MKNRNILLTIVMILCVAMTSACSDSSDDPTPKPSGDKSQRSVLFYIAAQNSLGNAGASRLDSAEIVRGASQLSSGDNVFLFLDDAKLPRLYRIYKYGKRTITEKILTWQTDVYSTDPATLCQLLTTVSTKYPSESYALVMWSHGNGWIPATTEVNTLRSKAFGKRSFGIDVGPDGNLATDTNSDGVTGAQMNISDMARAIAKSGVHLDYIFFDACLMQNIEVAYELKDVTDYVVASATTTSAYGGYYINLIPKALFAYPANDANIALIANQYYYDAVENQSLHKYYGDMGNVISAIKTAPLTELAQATAQYLKPYFANRTAPDLDNIQAYMSTDRFNMPDYFDMGSAMWHILSADEYKAWLSVADKCIIAHKASTQFTMTFVNNQAVTADVTDPDHVMGVSMFLPRAMFDRFPYSPYNTYFQTTQWYSAMNWSTTGW